MLGDFIAKQQTTEGGGWWTERDKSRVCGLEVFVYYAFFIGFCNDKHATDMAVRSCLTAQDRTISFFFSQDFPVLMTYYPLCRIILFFFISPPPSAPHAVLSPD